MLTYKSVYSNLTHKVFILDRGHVESSFGCILNLSFRVHKHKQHLQLQDEFMVPNHERRFNRMYPHILIHTSTCRMWLQVDFRFSVLFGNLRTCLNYFNSKKFSQVVCLIDTHILIYRQARCDCMLYDASWFAVFYHPH